MNGIAGFHRFPRRLGWPALVCAALALVGCRTSHAIRDPEYAAVAVAPSPSEMVSVRATQPDLAGPHPVEDYVDYALAQNPQVHAKRKLVEAAHYRIPQAASLEDPMLDATGYPLPDNAPQLLGGRKTVDLMVSQKVPWFGKRQSQVCAAQAEVCMAQAELLATEQEIVEQVKRAYYDLFFAQTSIAITERSRELALDLQRVATVKYQTGLVSEQDVLRAQLEVSNMDLELVRLRQELATAQARLARRLPVSPDTPVRALGDLPAEQIPADVERLYAQAIAVRPELQAQLAALQRGRSETARARLQYYPDVTVGFGWGNMTGDDAMHHAAEGMNEVSMRLGANLPLYRRRLDAAVREAEAKTVASVYQYASLRDQTQEEIKDLFAQATSQQELLRLFRTDILPRAEQTLRASQNAYETGKVDFLQLIDNWQQLLRYRLAQARLESQVRQTLATLERTIGGPLPEALPTSPPSDAPPPDPPRG